MSTKLTKFTKLIKKTFFKTGFVNITRKLLENGANINAQEMTGKTPLHIAALSGKKHTFLKHPQNKPSSVRLSVRKNTDFNQIRLHISDLDLIIELLLQNRANASITDDNESTPLFIAVQYSK